MLSACVALADEPKPPVVLEATISPPKQRGHIAFLQVGLVGTGKDVSVVTEGLSVKVARADKKATVTITPEERKDEKGRVIVRSAAKLGIVKLQPDEVAGVQFSDTRDLSYTQDLQKALIAAVAGELEVVVEYEIAEAFGKRYGVASGKVRGAATVTK